MRYEFHKPEEKKPEKNSSFLSYAAAVAVAGLAIFGGAKYVRDKANVKQLSDLEKKVAPAPEIEKPKLVVENYNPKELYELQNILYGEAADQSRKARKKISRMILNRARSEDYPSTIEGVIYEKNAFSCINDEDNKNWKQAIGKLEMNAYDKMIYKRCGEDAKAILDGERLGIQRENEIIAYHDTSVKYKDLVAKELELKEKWKKKGKIYKTYWEKLEPVCQDGNLIFYAPKK